MRWNRKLVTPPPPLFLKSGDSRGVKGPASCLKSISLKVIDCKGVRRRGLGRA